MTVAIFKAHRALLAAATLLVVFAVPVHAATKEATLAERLQLLEDKEAIRTLLERFYEYQENRNFDAFANLFAKDGELILRRGHTKGGPAGIKAAFTRQPAGGADAARRAPPAQGAAARGEMRHIFSNAHIVVTGDTATAESRFTLISETDDKRTRVGGTGRYVDKLVRENGEWKFLRRVLYRDLPADPEGNPKVDP